MLLYYLLAILVGMLLVLIADFILFLLPLTKTSDIPAPKRFEIVQYGENTHCLRYGTEGDWIYYKGTLRNNLSDLRNYGTYSLVRPIPSNILKKYQDRVAKMADPK